MYVECMVEFTLTESTLKKLFLDMNLDGKHGNTLLPHLSLQVSATFKLKTENNKSELQSKNY